MNSLTHLKLPEDGGRHRQKKLGATTEALPQIGFDRFVSADWVTCVLKIRTGVNQPSQLDELLKGAGLGNEARAKTITKLNALGLRPRVELADFVDRGIKLAAGVKCESSVVLFAWGVAIATYPFFGKVAEVVGRLTSIQGDCSTAEIHRRMVETYGDRQVTKRATQAVLQSQCNWGVLERVEKGRRAIRMSPIAVDNEDIAAWLIEAAVRYLGKPISVRNLQSLPALFPFNFQRPLTYVVSKSSKFDVWPDGANDQLIALQAAY